MARRLKRKPWNADVVLFPELLGLPPTPPPPAPEHRPLEPASGLVFSPQFEDKQPPPPPADRGKPTEAE